MYNVHITPHIRPLCSVSGALVNWGYSFGATQAYPNLKQRLSAIPLLAASLVEVIFRVFTTALMGIFSQFTRHIDTKATNFLTKKMDRIGYQGLMTTFHSVAFSAKCLGGQVLAKNKRIFNVHTNNALTNKHLVCS